MTSLDKNSRLEAWRELDGSMTWKLELTARDAYRFERERWDMIEDAMWLIRMALQGQTEGPLTLPRLKVPVR